MVGAAYRAAVLFRRKRPPAGIPPPVHLEVPPEPSGRFSSGIPDLDVLLGGGNRAGTVVAVVGDPTVRNEDFFQLSLPTVFSFLARGRGALIVPPAGIPPAQVRFRALRYVSETLIDARARLVDYSSVEVQGPWLVPMGRQSRVEAMRSMVRAERDAAGDPRAPYLELTAVDAHENLVGPEVTVRMFTQGFQRTRAIGNLGLTWLRSTSASRDAILGMTDDCLALSRDGDRLMVRGIRPSLPPREIEWAEAEGTLRVSLGLASDPLLSDGTSDH
jgi:hypothetical protein